MKKEAFFALLKEKLNVIEESELQDILDEYEQHISMKMVDENVTEEEAIEGFGDIEELTADILQAYHVRVQDNHKKKGDVSEKGKKLLADAKKQVSHIFEKKEKIDTERETVTGKKNSFGNRWSKCCRNLKSVIKAVCTACYRAVSFCMKCLWKLCCLFLLFMAGFSSCFFLFLLGASFVLLLQKYPLWGTLIVCLGMTFSSLAATVAIIRYLRGNRRSLWTWLPKGTPTMLLVVVFFGGVLLSGIGTGIGMIEFSHFTYGGSIFLQQGKEKTEQACTRVPVKEDTPIFIRNVMENNQDMIQEITWDEQIPVGQICYEITHNGKSTVFQASYTEMTTFEDTEVLLQAGEAENNVEEEKKSIETYIYSYYPQSDLEQIFMLKDDFLKDLKNHVLHDYSMDFDIKDVKVLVNPAMKGKVELSR